LSWIKNDGLAKKQKFDPTPESRQDCDALPKEFNRLGKSFEWNKSKGNADD
jgi:hypothetical protein